MRNRGAYNVDPVVDSLTLLSQEMDFETGIQAPIISPDSGTTINVENYQSGAIFTNDQFTVNTNYFLPPATSGLEYWFYNTQSGSPNDMNPRVDEVGDSITDGTGTYSRVQIANEDGYVHLVCITDTVWRVMDSRNITLIV